MRSKLLLILAVLIVLSLVIAYSGKVGLGVRVGDTYRYRGVYRVYGVRGESSSNPLIISINVTILGFTNNTVVIREEHRLEVPLNNTSLPKGVETYPIVFLEPAGFSVNYSLIPYVVSLDTVRSLWNGSTGRLKIEFWGLNNTSIRISGVIDTVIGKCKCLTIEGHTTVWRVVQRNISATLCYNEEGLLGYATINTSRRIGDSPPKRSIYELEIVNSTLKTQSPPQKTTMPTSLKETSTTIHSAARVVAETTTTTTGGGMEKTIVLSIVLVVIAIVLGVVAYLKRG